MTLELTLDQDGPVNPPWQHLGLLVLGGSAGTLARYLIASAISAERYPWGITVVNLSGALLFGSFWGLFEANAVARAWYLLVLTGFMGAYTTFSTWVFEIVRAAEQGRFVTSVLHLLIHVVLGVALVWIGMWIGRSLKLGLS